MTSKIWTWEVQTQKMLKLLNGTFICRHGEMFVSFICMHTSGRDRHSLPTEPGSRTQLTLSESASSPQKQSCTIISCCTSEAKPSLWQESGSLIPGLEITGKLLHDQKKGMPGHSNKETKKGKVQQFYTLNASPWDALLECIWYLAADCLSLSTKDLMSRPADLPEELQKAPGITHIHLPLLLL